MRECEFGGTQKPHTTDFKECVGDETLMEGRGGGGEVEEEERCKVRSKTSWRSGTVGSF